MNCINTITRTQDNHGNHDSRPPLRVCPGLRSRGQTRAPESQVSEQMCGDHMHITHGICASQRESRSLHMCCHMLYRRTVTRTARLTLTRALGTNSRSWQTGARGTRGPSSKFRMWDSFEPAHQDTWKSRCLGQRAAGTASQGKNPCRDGSRSTVS